jgi:predicted ribosomally synthesized peptide with SipW-like signal peptide
MRDETFELTRRKALAGLGAVGLAGAGAGVGTSALFTDEESFTNNSITAGTLDMSVTATVVAASEYYTESGDGPNVVGDMATADGAVVAGLQAGDVKPGDWIIICFDVTVGDNPGYVEVSAADFAQYENGQTEPESEVDGTPGGSLGLPLDGQGQGELQDELLAEVYGSFDGSVSSDDPRDYLGDQDPTLSGSAKQTFDQFATGVTLGGSAFPTEVGPSNSPVSYYLLLELPKDVGNEVQSDAIEFDLVFRTVQVRNNDAYPTKRGLVGYWPLDSVGDGTAEDLSGNGNDGTVVGDVASATGQVATAGSFDGTGDYVEIGDDASLGVENVTVAAWVYRDGAKNRVYVVDGRDHNYFLKFDDGTSTPRFGVMTGGSFTILNADSGDIPDQTWTHVVATYDGSELDIYVDGSHEGSASASGDIDSSAGPARIGDYIGGGYEHTGLLDDVRVYDRALSQSEVTTLYDATK